MRYSKVRIVLYTLLIFVLILAIYFHNNTAEVFSHFGDYYLKHNQPQKAINYYERALSQKNYDRKFREKYVNTLINHPLTIESQKKLVEIADGEIQDTAAYNAEYFLYNLKREIHNKYPLNYIKQAPFNQKIMHWGEMPITYSFKNASAVSKELVNAVNDAFDEWERASSCRIKFKRESMSNSNIIIVFMSDKYEKLKEDEKTVIAYTTPILTQNKLKNMVIKFNIYNPEGKMYSPDQMYNTALHEVFHSLGFMGHSYDKNNIMYMAKERETNERIKLNDADKMTLELLYKIQPDITNAGELNYEYVPYLILGDSEEVNYSKINEAKNYIRKAPRLAMGYIDMADALVAQKRYSAAIGNLEKALRLAKNDEIRSIVYYNLAVSHFYITNYELALDYVNRAQEIKDSEDLHLLKAEIYSKQKNNKLSAAEYEYLYKNSPNNIDYLVNLAAIYKKSNKYMQARKILKDYIKRNPVQKNNPKIQQFGFLIF